MVEDKAICTYFQWIYDRLNSASQVCSGRLYSRYLPAQLNKLKIDFKYLIMFCLYVESFDYATDKDNMARLRSMLTSLKLMWPEQHKGLCLLTNLRKIKSLSGEFNYTMKQSRQQIEDSCEYLLYSSIQCKSPNFFRICNFLQHLRKCLKKSLADYWRMETSILKKKVVIMEKWLNNIEGCQYTRKISQFLDFINVFSNKVACLTCLDWAEVNDRKNKTDIEIVLVDTLRMFIPFATDVIPLYTGFLKAYNLQPSYSFVYGESVNLFFGHLDIVLEDDFQPLRDQLVFLFTFLTDPPCVTKEEYSIRTKIYDLFRADTYLLLPFDEMKEDFLGQKVLLSDFMMKIDMVTTEIRHLYDRFPDSRIGMEVEKIDNMYFLSVQRELSLIEEKREMWVYPMLSQLKSYKMKLRYLRMFLLCFATFDESDEEISVRLSSMIASLQEIWGKEEKEGVLALRLHEIQNITAWNLLAFELEEKIHLSKVTFETWLENLFHRSFLCKPSTIYKIMKFMNLIIENLNDLVTRKAFEIVLFKKQIESLEEKLTFLKNFLGLTVNCIHTKQLGEFKSFAQTFVNDAACLTFMYWAKDANDKVAYETNSKLTHMLQKIKPITPDVARVYFGTLKVICAQRSDPLMFGHTVLSFVDLLCKDTMATLKEDFHILRDNILFLLTFLNDHPNENVEELSCSQNDVIFWDGLYGLLPFGDMELDFSEKKILLSDFVMKIETVNANIRLIYCMFPDSSLYNFPTVISPHFLDFLVQNLRTLEERMISEPKYLPFSKHNITKMKEELITLCPYFNYIFDCQNELKETWFEVVNLLHLTEHVISMCISSWFVGDYPIWYHMAYFYDVFDRAKIVKIKLKEIKKNTMSNARCLPRSCSLFSTLSEQAKPLKINEVIVGLEDEVEKVIGKLIMGHKPLNIVSIVGMGGLGKTTLAKIVYNSSTVKGNFDKLAFCSVSQNHDTKRLLLDILCDIEEVDGISAMTKDDLAHKLWKCLSRQKYFIVLDDMWDISAWNELKNSFPDDKIGSRVLFTTRSHEIADKCKISCTIHHLRFMSDDESWELLQKKAFRDGISPPHLFEVGKLIAENCKGLPLAVCVIAGVLARIDESLVRWSEVSENLVSYLSGEGCMKILELSYNHLPEYLKPCFIYLGAFPEDWVINVKKLLQLWIAEGFVQESKTKRLEDVAKDYFYDLVDRSLIIIHEISPVCGINSFRVHDLIHDLCQIKCREGNFFQFRQRIASFSSSDPSLYNNYRVSTRRESDITFDSGPSFSNTSTLLYFHGQCDYRNEGFPLREYRLAHVLDLNNREREYEHLSFMVHLRYINAPRSYHIPSSISNLWNIGYLMLNYGANFVDEIHLPKTFWRLKSLRHVKIDKCILNFSDVHEVHETCPELVKLVSFSKPILSSGKDLQQLLQRLPAVRDLSCYFKRSTNRDEQSLKTLDFFRDLESLNLIFISKHTSYLFKFPSTLKKLTINKFALPWAAVSAIAELPSLEALKLKEISFPEPRLDMEDMTFQNLKYFELSVLNLVEWNASNESLPCLVILVIKCPKLKDLPPCFGESSTLKGIAVMLPPEAVKNSALRIMEEQMELGNKVEVEAEAEA